MIPRTPAAVQSIEPDWQRQLQQAPLTPAELLAKLGLTRQGLENPQAPAARQPFPLRVPPAYLARIRPNDPDDPLLRQILPRAEENQNRPGFSDDPVGDRAAEKRPGLLHKYHGRVLLTLTGACAIHCRYCFRRHFPYADSNPSRGQWQATLDYIRSDDSIREVIFSGGDPLTLSDARLAEMATALSDIPHLKRLRVHSRLPLVLPDRITDDLLEWLTGSHLQAVMVVHCNHANEIGIEAGAALQRLHERGVHLLNQSVLLAGVNDRADALINLSETLFENHVLPYYLHRLDPVTGAAHFEVGDERARELMDAMLCALPGYLVPRLVREVSGAPYKMPLL